MIRIFGIYNLNGNPGPLFDRMSQAFQTNSLLHIYNRFAYANVSFISESVKGETTASVIDTDKGQACFVVGNAHAFEETSLKLLTGTNTAQFILDKYRVSGLKSFKNFRGVFNILIIDKKRVYLINDALGLSPMYLYKTGDNVIFCTDPDPIIWLDRDNRIDHHAIAEFIVYGFVPEGKTFIDGLYNQAPGSILMLGPAGSRMTRYFDFRPMDLTGRTGNACVRLGRDIFREAVNIRIAPNTGEVFSDLSGGWDTRFILANLRDLDKKVVTYTEKINTEDLAIAKRIAKNMGIEHEGIDLSRHFTFTPRHVFDLTYFKHNAERYFTEIQRRPTKQFKSLFENGYFTRPRFSGLYGGELLGKNLPIQFEERTKLDFNAASKLMLAPRFLKMIDTGTRGDNDFREQNILSVFLGQMGRTFLNTHYTSGWERPTVVFTQQALIPFADSKLLSFLCAERLAPYKRYQIYESIYQAYYPEYLSFPWTVEWCRNRNDLRRTTSKNPMPKRMRGWNYSDKRFIAFLKKRRFVRDDTVIVQRVKELYFVFQWLDIYRSVIDHHDRSLCE